MCPNWRGLRIAPFFRAGALHGSEDMKTKAVGHKLLATTAIQRTKSSYTVRHAEQKLSSMQVGKGSKPILVFAH